MSVIKKNHEDDNIDFLEIAKILFNQKKLILKSLIYAFLFGIIIALISPSKYTSSSIFVPQLSSNDKVTGSSLSGLASLAGINLSDIRSEGSEISPILYPKIIESTPFRLELLNSTIIYKDNNIKLRDFLLSQKFNSFLSVLKKYTIGLPSLLFNLFKAEDNLIELNKQIIYEISKEDNHLFMILDKILSISINAKDGFINLNSTFNDSEIPAQVIYNAEKILQNKIIDYKIQSSKELLTFTKQQYDLKRVELNNLQDEIAIFRDQNININSSLFQNKLDRLLSESQILQSVVQQLASQVEQAKLQVSKDTPVFTIIQPVNIPYQKSGPSRFLIVLTFIIVGLISSSLYIIIKKPLAKILEHIKS